MRDHCTVYLKTVLKHRFEEKYSKNQNSCQTIKALSSWDFEGSTCSAYIFCLLDSCFLNKRSVLIPVEAQEPLEGKAPLRCYLWSFLNRACVSGMCGTKAPAAQTCSRGAGEMNRPHSRFWAPLASSTSQ